MQLRRARGPVVDPIRLATLFLMFASATSSWAQVIVPPIKPPVVKPQPAPPKPAEVKLKGPTTIEAQSIEGVPDLEVTARGQVELKRDDITIYSDLLRYNQEFGRVEADGGVRLQRGGDRFFGSRLRFDTTNDTGVFEEPTFIIQREQQGHGAAERLEMVGKNHIKLTRGWFTSCQPGQEDWRFDAGEMDLDYEAGVGKVSDGKLTFLDTPILWLPFGSFPLENRRKSGFLAPYYSHNTRRGLEVGIPYYWNIAPEVDMTLKPVYMTKRGEQLKSEFRYLDSAFAGNMRYDYMPEDKVLGTSRSAFSFQHQHQITPNLLGWVDLNKVSDNQYLVDLASQVRVVSLGNLQREGFLQYTGEITRGNYYAQARVQRYQTLQDPAAPIVPPYHRLPQLNAGVTRNEIGGVLDVSLPAEYVRFTHDTLVQGDRFSMNPVFSTPFLGPGHFFVPKLGVRYAEYSLSGVAAGQPERQTATIPWLSLDGGLTFERNAQWFGKGVTQTLEPRAYFVYAPFRNQDQIPLFDTTLADFNYAQLFNENRFVGGDRFGDTEQITLALTSRIVGEGGQELFRALIGQRYYLKDERVALTPTTPPRASGQSDILASIGGKIGSDWSFDATGQYNPQLSQMQRYGISARFSPEIAKVVNASYRYNRDILHQVDVSGQWPVFQGWYAVGRYNYSLRDGRLLEGIAGFERNAGCWIFRVLFSRLQASTTTTSSAFYMQLEFPGVGGLGSDDILTILRRNIQGYAATNPGNGAFAPPSMRRQLPFEQIF
ncbi:MAG TPA: LPS-assembly protein LptD [Burkholderiales bacterium]|nr:LPS-assembly protein LptD [Burkholderiales bacterium]